MAASPWVAHEFNYTITICGNDREAIFSDCVWSVRSCEGSLRKRGHSMFVRERDAHALIAPATISGKLCVRRTPPDQLTAQSQPRAVLRIANRVNNRDAPDAFEPFLQDLQNDVARLSRAFATLGREANALVRSEAQMRARIEIYEHSSAASGSARSPEPEVEQPALEIVQPVQNRQMSRQARRRMRVRMRAALDRSIPPVAVVQPPVAVAQPPVAAVQPPPSVALSRQNGYIYTGSFNVAPAFPASSPPVTPSSSSAGQSQPISEPQTGNGTRNKKKRRHRR